jgi:hypothetical protein
MRGHIIRYCPLSQEKKRALAAAAASLKAAKAKGKVSAMVAYLEPPCSRHAAH